MKIAWVSQVAVVGWFVDAEGLSFRIACSVDDDDVFIMR